MLGTNMCLFAQQSRKVGAWGRTGAAPALSQVASPLCWLSNRIWGQSPYLLPLSQASLPSFPCDRGIPSPAYWLTTLLPVLWGRCPWLSLCIEWDQEVRGASLHFRDGEKAAHTAWSAPTDPCRPTAAGCALCSWSFARLWARGQQVMAVEVQHT